MKEKLNVRADSPNQIADCVGQYIQAGDLEGIVSMYHPDCIIYFPEGEPPKKGLGAVREIFAPFLQEPPTLISQVTGELINGDVALLQGEWRFEDAAGNIVAQGSSTEVAKRLEDGSWGYFIDCPFGAPAP